MRSLFVLFISIIFLPGGMAQSQPDIYVKDVLNPVVSLNGTWKICLNPSGEFWNINQPDENWKEIQVPGECMMQGFPVKHDKPVAYKKEMNIPIDFKNKIIKIRFEGVYSYARIWVNGRYMGEHSGGFTAWECDITIAVVPGGKAMLTVEVTDRADEISFASGYAKHPIGGILRSVSLLALPGNYPENLSVLTDFDEVYRNAVLTVQGKIRKAGKSKRIELELYDRENHNVGLDTSSFLAKDTLFRINNRIIEPLKWDAEHPNLYRLKVTFVEDGIATWHKYFSIGFREIEVKGNRFLVNGNPVKLRGACHHDIHPLLGRVSTPDYELKDVLLAREANINFIRTSHYPPTDHFLQLCDEYGIYVEDETAVCFVGTHRAAEYYPGSSESSPAFTSRYLLQLKEMVDDHRNHPSVIIWSIGNENSFGSNFKKSYDWVKGTDPGRPIIFSYPGKVPDSLQSCDIMSMHYPGIDGNMEQYGKTTTSFGSDKMPVIFDEWAHVACYNNFTVKEDPNVRNFWGMSLDSMWQKTYDADGGLGGAIWGMIDETFMLPEDLPGKNEWWGKIDKNIIPYEYKGNTIGYGEWGIVDTWRRKKPEFWNVKKAYSPVRILKTSFYDFKPNAVVEIPVYNRFDFTNLSELTLRYTCKGIIKNLNPSNIPAHTKGIIRIPMGDWAFDEPLLLEFTDSRNMLIDRYELFHKKQEMVPDSAKHEGIITLTEDDLFYTIRCMNNTSFHVDKKTGLFSSVEVSGKKVAFSGPCLNIRTMGNELSHPIHDFGNEWKMKSLSVKKSGNHIEVLSKGDCPGVSDIGFLMLIFADGSITTTYTASNLPKEYIREMGIKFTMDDVFDSLSWNRDPYWSVYPVQHLSAPEGRVSLYNVSPKIYRKAPEKEWQYDAKSFYYNGTENENREQLPNIARATKENIREYNLHMSGIASLVVTGTAREGCRIDRKESKINLYISNKLDYPDLGWGNYQRNILPDKIIAGKIQMAIQTWTKNKLH